MDTSKTSVGKSDLVWPPWLEPSFVKQAPLRAMTLQVTCLTTAWGEESEEWGGRGLFFPSSRTPAVVQFPLRSSGSCIPVSFRHVALFSPLPPLLLLSSSFSLRLIWAALAGPLTRMVLIGEKQCGDMLSVPVENSTLNLKQRAPKPGHNNTATWLGWLFGPGAAVEEQSQRNHKESWREKRRRERDTILSSNTECSEWWSELTGGGSWPVTQVDALICWQAQLLPQLKPSQRACAQSKLAVRSSQSCLTQIYGLSCYLRRVRPKGRLPSQPALLNYSLAWFTAPEAMCVCRDAVANSIALHINTSTSTNTHRKTQKERQGPYFVHLSLNRVFQISSSSSLGCPPLQTKLYAVIIL